MSSGFFARLFAMSASNNARTCFCISESRIVSEWKDWRAALEYISERRSKGRYSYILTAFYSLPESLSKLRVLKSF